MINKLRNNFDEMVVYKDLKKSNFFSALSLPSFMRDWLLKRAANDEGEFDTEELLDFIKKYLPRKDEWTAIKSRLITEGERIKFLAKISVNIDIKTGEISFSLPDFGLNSKDTIIEEHVWHDCKDELISSKERWGMIELDYRYPDAEDKTAQKGKIRLRAYKDFCPYEISLDHYKDARKQFTTSEWIDILLGAVDYNAMGYEDKESKLTMLTRLLPFLEKRLNLIELAPKGTGKSYLYGSVSRFGWLSSGGVMSRAKMFYDQNKRTEGLIAGNDFLVLDEVQTISFTDVDEMRAALKGYLESGRFTVGNYEGVADAGMILCGNIKKETMDGDGFSNMFEDLPKVFHESALIERFHGIIRGWNIPRMNDDLKIAGWALNSEYFCSILHDLRDDISYRAIVDQLIEVPEAADTRDTEAVKRITTAYLKLLFPHVCSVEDVNRDEFEMHCFHRALKMRETILYQLGMLDVEYKYKNMPKLSVIKEKSE